MEINCIQIFVSFCRHDAWHTSATMLLKEDVDIRYIRQIPGHSSIVTTQIYTHVSSAKQKEILTDKLLRNRIGL